MKCASLFVLVVAAFLPMVARAQVQTGAPPFGTLSGGPDIVDVANLNAHSTIPIFSKAGRGLPFNFYLTQDSSIWYPVTSGSTTSWQPVTSGSTAAISWGWNQSEANIGSMTDHVSHNSQLEQCGDQQGFSRSTNWTNWAYTDGFHTSHPFAIFTSQTVDACTGDVTTTSAQGTATDGSGYTLSLTGGSVTQLVGPDGSLINPNTGAGRIQDRNGNLISLSNTGVITDTLGQAAMTIGGSGTPSSPNTFTYPAPSTANAAYTEKFASYTVQTNFGCSGISEFGPTSENLVSEIDLPDDNPNGTRDRYTISYEITPGHSGNVTGRIASIQLPTGGTITYTYSGGTGTNGSGIVCADGSTATLTRQTPDGTWTYAHSESGTAWTTTVTDPQGNQTIYDFQGIYQTERKVFQGTSTLLEDDVTCYNGNTSNCNTTAITLPIAQRIVTKTLGSQVCKHVYFYNSFGLLTEQDDYDYGSGTPGSLIRSQLISYASLGNNIVDAPSQITVRNGGTTVAETTITYDGTSVAAPSGTTPQHVAITGARGNATSISYTVAGSTTLTKSFTYFDTGNIQTATDVNGSQSTVTYNYPDATSTCGNAFPTSVSEPLSLSKSMAWNCTGGVETSATDENAQTVSTAWTDANFWRPASNTDQAGNQTTFSYPSPTSAESSMAFNGTSSTVDVLKTLDSLGRIQVTQQREAPGSGNFDSVESDYDSLGRQSRATVPYVGAASGTNGSTPATTQTYDGLSRPLVTTDGGGGTVTLSYTGNDTLQTVGPPVTGENTKRRQSEYNSIGQLTSVCEVTSLTGSGTCGQTTSATGYWTKYTYDVLGDLLTVAQNAQSGSAQPRTYTYDGLGRMTSEKNPETGTISYVYDTDSTCGTSKGDLVKRTDAAGNVTCYAYDALHRNTSITYPSGPNSGSNSPNKCFLYDAAIDSETVTFTKARLAEAYTTTSACSQTTLPATVTDEAFSYTVRGEVTKVYESTPHSGGYFWVTQTYLANGAPNVQNNNLSAVPAITNGVDGEGRVSTVSGASGQNPVTGTSYNVASEVTGLTLGSSDSDAFTFDPNTFRMTQYKFTVGATPKSVVANLTWNPNGSLGQLAITDAFNSTNTQTCTYSHDDLARIASGNCGSVWSQTFSYDAFGNITKAGTNSFNPGYNPATNQMSSGATYDSNGDVLTDSLHTFAWDVETRPTTIDTVTATYDALGRMVEQTKSGTSMEIVYDCVGNKLALMKTASTLVTAFVPLPGGGTAVYGPGGLQYYRHPDWLGSSRFSSTPSRTMYNDLAYAPFGEQYAQAGTTGVTNTSFAGNNQDTTTNLYDAQFREYEIYGRWPSPDPAGLAAANPANPQSWNRYAYVMNNPLLSIDPMGLSQHPLYACGEDGFGCNTSADASGGVCTLNGAEMPCSIVEGALSTGAADECGNYCGLVGTSFLAPNGVQINIVAGPDGLEYTTGNGDEYCNGAEFGMPNFCGDGSQVLEGLPGYVPYPRMNPQIQGYNNTNAERPMKVTPEPELQPVDEPPPDLQNPFWKLFDEILQDVLGPPPKLTFPFIIPNPCVPNLRTQFPGLCGGPMA